MTRKVCTFTVALATMVSGLVALTWAQAPAGGFSQFWGPLYTYPAPNLGARGVPPPDPVGQDAMHHWNRIAIDSAGLDHTPVAEGDPRIFGEQLGPGRSSRAMAIVHIAIFDAVNAIAKRYRSYTGIPDALLWRVDRCRDRAGRARHAGGDVSIAEGALRPAPRRRARQDSRQPRQERGHPGRSARRARHPAAHAPMTAPTTPSRASASTSSRAIGPASGARIRSASCRSRSARIGATSRRLSCRMSGASGRRRRPR